MSTDNETNHLDPRDAAAFIDGRLRGTDRDRVVEHLADCAPCRDEVASVRQTLATDRAGYRRTLWIAAAAAAAIAGIMVVGPLLESGGSTPTPVFRAADPISSTTIEVVEPRDTVPARSNQRFTWRSIGEDAIYTLQVLRSDGELVWSERQLVDTSAVMPSDVRLDAGTTYLWTVEALRTDGRAFESRTQRFVVAR
jgi:hypothetical protein